MKKPLLPLSVGTFIQSAAVIAALLNVSSTTHAVSATWNGNTSGSWATTGNWTSVIPGSATAAASSDIATFNTNSANTSITVDTTRYIGGLLFDTGAGAYTFGGGTLYINCGSGSGITATGIVINSGVTANQTFNNNIAGYRSSAGAGGYGFTNNSASALLTINGNITGLSTGATALTLAGSGSSIITGIISNGSGGALGITKSNLGTWTLSGANTFSGTTSITSGTLVLDYTATTAPTSNIGGTNTLAIGSGTASTSTLQINGKADTANTQSYSSLVATAGASHINLTTSGAGSMTLALTGALSGVSTTRSVGATLDISLPSTSTKVTVTGATNQVSGILGAITINGSDFATKDASGNLVAFTGYTANTSGGLGNANQVADVKSVDTTLASSAAVSGLRFNEAADRTITISGNRQLAVGGAYYGAILVTSTVGAHLSKITGGILQGSSSRDLVILQNNTQGDLQIDSVITNYGTNIDALTKSGAGKLILTANNTYTGNSYVNEGTVVVGGNYVAGGTQTLTTTAGSATITVTDASNLFVGQRVTGANVVSGGGSASNSLYILSISGNTVTLSSTASVSGAAAVVFWDGGGLGTASGTVQIASGATVQIGNGGASGSLDVGQSVSNNGTVSFNRTDSLSFSNVISGSGNVSQIGSGRTILTGLSTYSGGTYVNSGTLQLGIKNALATTGAVTVSGGTFNVDAYDQTVGSLTLVSGAVQGGAGTLTSTSAYDIRSGSVSANLSGYVGLNKTTSGTATLSGSNGYSGNTTVSAGAIVISGSLTANTNTTTVKSGASLSGAGSLQALVAEHGAVVDPGNGAASINGAAITTNGVTGKLTTGAFNLQSGSYLAIQLASTSAYDQIESSTLTLSGNLDLSLLTGASVLTGDIFYVAIADTTRIGTFANADEGSTITAGTQEFTITYLANWTGDASTSTLTGGNDVALIAVPEPQAWASIIGGTAMLLGLQNLRRRKQ
ncbi:MAG: beta strand repeat-containing protein [Chthoniobacteraceae bacterium]